MPPRVWLNGTRLGDIRGAFIRGVFDVTRELLPGRANALAVRIHPPPAPGDPVRGIDRLRTGRERRFDGHRWSRPSSIRKGGDWIPGIRDRGQRSVAGRAPRGVRRRAHSGCQCQSRKLPLPRTDRAALTLIVPFDNAAADNARDYARGSLRGASHCTKSCGPARPAHSEVRLDPQEFSAAQRESFRGLVVGPMATASRHCTHWRSACAKMGTMAGAFQVRRT